MELHKFQNVPFGRPCSFFVPTLTKGQTTLKQNYWGNGSLIASGQYRKIELESKILTFLNSTDYLFEWWDYDVGNTFSGKYYILDNPKRGLKIITFIPDIQLDDKDAIRIAYMNFDLASISTNRLQVVDETKRDSLTYIRFSKNLSQ